MTSEAQPARTEDDELAARTAALRSAFDRAFADAPTAEREAGEPLLAVGVAGHGYALRLRELAGLFADRKILALPSAAPGMLGLTGLRGTLLPVYSLAAALGHTSLPDPPRWLVVAVAGPERQLGLAFDLFEGYLRVSRSQLGTAADPSRPHVPETLRVGEQTRAIVSIASVAAAIAKRADSARLGRET